MEFGIFLSGYLPRPWNERSEITVFEQERELAVRADQAGFTHLWMSEHHFMEEYCHSSAPELHMAAIAGLTKNIRLSHGIVDMQPQINHPVRVAERIATLDLISGGRVEFGSGRGSGVLEWGGFGVDEKETKAAWEEALRAVLAMWTTEQFSWDGDLIKIPGPRNVIPKPVQKPHPPLWMACTNPETAYEAGQRGIGALLFAYTGLEDIAERVQIYRDGCKNPKGRFSDVINDRVMWTSGGLCDKDDKIGIERSLTSMGRGLGLFARYWPQAVGGTLKVNAKIAAAPTEEDIDVEGLMAKDGIFAGDPKRILELVHRTHEAGVDNMVISLAPGLASQEHLLTTIDLWGEFIIPEMLKAERVPA